jgi:hypothetical protein
VLAVILDNRSTAHLAPRDIFQSDFDRQLYRITLVGEPCGRPAVAFDRRPADPVGGGGSTRDGFDQNAIQANSSSVLFALALRPKPS